MPTVAAMSVIVTPSARSKIIRPRLATPTGMAVERCHTRSVRRSARVRRTVKEVVRPRAIQSPLSTSTRMSRIGSMATQLERFFMSGEFSCLSVVPALFDRRAPNSPTTLRLRSRCTSADSADVLAGVFTTAFYFDCLRIAVCLYSMEPSSYAVSSDRGVQARCVVNALHVHAAYAVSSRTATRCARSMRCPRESGAMSSQGSIFFPRWVSVTRNHVAINESV